MTKALNMGIAIIACIPFFTPGCRHSWHASRKEKKKAHPRLSITAIYPTRSRVDGGGNAVIKGSGFRKKAKVFFGEAESKKVERKSTARLIVRIPASRKRGTVPITVVNPDGNKAVLENVFEYYPFPPPEIKGVSPKEGNFRTRVRITVTGSNFRKGIRAFLGKKEMKDVRLVSSTTIGFQVVNLPVGKYDIKVVNEDGAFAILKNGYTSKVMRDTPIARVRFGAPSTVYDSSLEKENAVEGFLAYPAKEAVPGLFRYIDPDPRTFRQRIYVNAKKDTNGWKRAVSLLGDSLPELKSFGFGMGQNPPVIPRNAGIVVEFRMNHVIGDDFWEKHPGAVLTYIIKGDPTKNPRGALVRVPSIVKGTRNKVVVIPCPKDSRFGLPPSNPGSALPNFRIAFPLEGNDTIPTLKPDGNILLSGYDHLGRKAVVRDFRTARENESNPFMAYSILRKVWPPRIRALIPLNILSID